MTGLDDYRLIRRLGEGGQGVVHLAEDRAGRLVAVKLLHRCLVDNPAARRRFVSEVRAAMRVAGFCTAQVLAADVAGDRPYIVSEYVAGPSLRQAVADHGPRYGGALGRLAVGTATALAAIHQAGVVHRDLKPGNVLLGPDGPRVIDFGAARALDATATTTSRAVGTPAYMAPEQLAGDLVGPPADVFAWGTTMVYAATGRPAFGDDTIPAVMYRITQAEPDLGALTGSLRSLVAHCLAKDPAARPTANQMINQLLGATLPAMSPC